MKFLTPDQKSVMHGECAVTGRESDPEGMFHCRTTLKHLTPAGYMDTDIPVFISAAAAKEMARILGYASPADIAAIKEAHEAQGAELEALKERLDKVEQFKALEEELVNA